MWSRLATLVLLAAALSFALGLAACGGSSGGGESTTAATPLSVAGVAAGDSVAALWTDGNYYLATVSQLGDGNVTVTYVDDGSTGTVKENEVRAIPEQTFAVGDRVMAVWSAGRFYPGEIASVDGTSYTVKWDDGSTPSTVEVTKIMAE
jgi:hypothetical protein